MKNTEILLKFLQCLPTITFIASPRERRAVKDVETKRCRSKQLNQKRSRPSFCVLFHASEAFSSPWAKVRCTFLFFYLFFWGTHFYFLYFPFSTLNSQTTHIHADTTLHSPMLLHIVYLEIALSIIFSHTWPIYLISISFIWTSPKHKSTKWYIFSQLKRKMIYGIHPKWQINSVS